MNRVTTRERIIGTFKHGWYGTADDWFASHPAALTINNVAPVFTELKQAGVLEAVGRKRTRAGGMATAWRMTGDYQVGR